MQTGWRQKIQRRWPYSISIHFDKLADAVEMRSSIRRWLRMIAATGFVQAKGVGHLFQARR